MSHLKERVEKNCLNCNAEVVGKYCHICGQENIEPKETAWHLVTHFFEDITHFDGKFFSTLRLLITRPGFLSAEYARGRRASYLNPIRMYIFTSAIFFLIFSSFFKIKEGDITNDSTINGKTMADVEKMDSAAFATYTRHINKEDHKKDIPMSRAGFKAYYDSSIENNGIHIVSSDHRYTSMAQYDSSLKKAGAEKDNWLERNLNYKQIEINNKFKNNPKQIVIALGEGMIHRLPQMLFLSLPLLALLLKLVYIRRKQFYYVSHSIFSIHLYIFIFIALLFSLALRKLNTGLHWGVLSFVNVLVSTAIFFYAYKAMRNFYQQRRAKTIIKFLVLNFSFALIVSLLFALFLFFSIFTL